MKTNTFLISLLAAIVFGGCTGFKQDPFQDKIEAIQNAKPPDTKPEPTRPMSPGAASIIVTNRTVFKEGKTGSFTLSVKSLLEGYSYKIQVANLDEFKNATFDAATGVFSWTPEQGTITSVDGFQEFTLKTSIVATPISTAVPQVPLVGNDPVTVIVQDNASRPTVKNVRASMGSPVSTFFEEGTSRSFVVTIEDFDSVNAAGMMPTLDFKGKLAEYTTASTPRFYATRNEWEFDIRIDLTTADLTKSVDTASLIISAQSRSSQLSAPFPKMDFTILMKFGTAASNLPVVGTEIKANVQNSIPFMIYDTNKEAVLNVLAPMFLPTGAQIICDKSTLPFQLCYLNWTPSSFDIGRNFNVLVPVEFKNPNPADIRTARSNVAMILRVVP